MDAQIDHLQRRLIELTTVKNGTISGDSKKSSSGNSYSNRIVIEQPQLLNISIFTYSKLIFKCQ